MISGSAPDAGLEYQVPVFRVGSVLRRALAIMVKHFVPFFAIGALASVPSTIYTWDATLHPRTAQFWAITLMSMVMGALCQAMIVYATFQALRGRRVRAGESIVRGMQRFVPVVLTTLLTEVLISVGLVVLIVPGCIAMTAFAVALPACVVERLGPTASMTRSSELTERYRWPVFGILIIVLIVGLVAQAAIDGALDRPATVVAHVVVSLVWSAVTTAFGAVLAALIYHDLRVIKEGIDLEQLAALFD